MKKAILTATVIILTILAIGRLGYLETHYTREATVINVEDELIIVEDEQGFIWDFEGTGFTTGDKVKMTMDNNLTDTNIEDDIIENVRLH